MTRESAEQVIARLKMSPIPEEGAWFVAGGALHAAAKTRTQQATNDEEATGRMPGAIPRAPRLPQTPQTA